MTNSISLTIFGLILTTALSLWVSKIVPRRKEPKLFNKIVVRIGLCTIFILFILFNLCRLVGVKIISITFITVITFLILIEFFLRFLRTQTRSVNSNLVLRKESARFDEFEVIKAIEPHKNSEYLTLGFWHEMQLFTSEGSAIKSKTQDDKIIVDAKNFKGKHISAHTGMRSTTDSPIKASGRVLLLGGSTVYCFEVPDSFTIASYMQRSLNESGDNLEVLNYGISGATVTNRIDKLLSIETLSEKDVVIFLFGDNDFGWQNFYMMQTLTLKILRRLSKYSVLLGWVYFELSAVGRKKTAVTLAEKNIEQLKKLSEKLKTSNIRHRFILQPNIYTKKNINDYESAIILRFGNEVLQMTRDAYSVYEKYLVAPFTSATNLMDGTIKSVYLDWGHVNAEGNKIISDFIVGLDILNYDQKN